MSKEATSINSLVMGWPGIKGRLTFHTSRASRLAFVDEGGTLEKLG